MKAVFWMLVGMRLAAQPGCMLEGVTTDFVTAKALSGVKVYAYIAARGSSAAYLRRTDARGRYCFERLAPGTYHIVAQHPGYLGQLYGARPGGNEAIELTVAGDRPLPAANLKLVPRPILTGTVWHADGQPAAGVEVTVSQKTQTRHGPDQEPVESRQTDDRGVFLFRNLAPGTYYLRAESSTHETERFNIEFLNGQGQRVREGETVTYFPSTSDFLSARPITLKAGQELSGITVTLRKAPLRRVSGRVSGATANRMVSLNPQTDGIDGAVIAVKPDGSFERSDLLPGKYSLMVEGESADRALAEQPVDLTTSDVEGLVLEPRETFRVPLVLRTEGPAPPLRPGQFWITLNSSSRGSSITAHPNQDGNTEFSNVLPDTYRVRAYTQGQPYFLKSVEWAGAARSAAALHLHGPSGGPLELIFSSKVATIDGHVNARATDAVTIVLAERAAADGDADERHGSSDQDGRFQLDNIKPGKYRLFAIEGFDDGLWGSTELAAALHSVDVDLSESETRHATVPLVTAKEWNAAVERFGQ